MKKFPVHSGPRARIAWAASARISGLRDWAIASSPPNRFMTAAVAIMVRGHKELHAIPFSRNSSAHPSVSMLMLYLEIVYATCAPNHLGSRFRGGESVSTCGLFPLFLRWGRHALVITN